MISMDKTYRTRDGREVRLLCVDAPNKSRPVVAILGRDVFALLPDGKHYDCRTTSEYDLIEVVPEVVSWVNVYSTASNGIVHLTREEADRYSNVIRGRIAILKITTKNNGVNGAEDVSVEVIPVGGP